CKYKDGIELVVGSYLQKLALSSGIIDTEATRGQKEETKSNEHERRKLKLLETKTWQQKISMDIMKEKNGHDSYVQ
ncbi:17028_t:CDS:1, partial [Gigaspora margarita]